MELIECILDSSLISEKPELIGRVAVENYSGRGERYRFSFSPRWVANYSSIALDPSLTMGDNYSNTLSFPFIEDAMPDRWGRNLIERREIRKAEKEKRAIRKIRPIDYLISQDDKLRKGALRIKIDGEYVSSESPSIPPIAHIEEYRLMIADYEENDVSSSFLDEFYSSSSSLGGARPKLSVVDNSSSLWIAKVPSKRDEYDVGGWEFVSSSLAKKAGINTSESKRIVHNGGFSTFLSKRFDRAGCKRVHMLSAKALINGTGEASFLDIATLISRYSYKPKEDLKELYRRLVFSIAINNTDNHLRNHAFLLTEKGLTLSPSYDMNPELGGRMSALSIDYDSPVFSFEKAKETAPYYDLSDQEEREIREEVLDAVSYWEIEAKNAGLEKEISLMKYAFVQNNKLI